GSQAGRRPHSPQRLRVLGGEDVVKFKPVLPLWPHQKEAVKRLWREGSLLLWHDVGTGKTRTAVTSAAARVQAGQAYRVMVVGPLASIAGWRTSSERTAGRTF